MRYYPPFPEYEKGQMFDPWKLGGYQKSQLGGSAPSTKGSLFLESARKPLGQEFSWLYGGRPLSHEEMQPLMATRGGRDPRMGTIGGMPSLGQGANAGLGTAYRPPTGFGPQVPVPGSTTGETQHKFPYQEVGPTPAAMRDVSALSQLPYDLMDQYRRVADQGIYGTAGMNTIVQTGILPSMERTKKMTTEALTYARAARQQTVVQGARMLAETLGGRFASQPGLAMQLMGDQVIAPSLAKEMEMSIDLKMNETNTLNALQGAIGDLVKANQESKMMGLAGVQDVMGFLQQRVAARWWDLSMENKFGWSPERTAAAGSIAGESMAALMQRYGLTNMRMDAIWRDWLNKQQWRREQEAEGDEGGGIGIFNPLSGCFITTAVMQHRGDSDDDSPELTLLRKLRDGYMSETPERRAEVEAYYKIAPEIVRRVEASGRAKSVWDKAYEQYIAPAVKSVRSGQFEKAYIIYRNAVRSLSLEWLGEPKGV